MSTTDNQEFTTNPKAVLDIIVTQDDLPFMEFLPTNIIEQHLEEGSYRNRVFTPQLTLSAFLSQIIGEDSSCQAAVSRIIANQIMQGIEPTSPNTAAYCKARLKLSENMISEITKAVARDTEDQVNAEWLWKGKQVKIVDGSTISMPDTPENQKMYPQVNTQKKG